MNFRPPTLFTTSPPIILITDHTQDPIITTHYHLGPNTIDFRLVYKSTKSLQTHPPCPHRPTPAHWPCPSCSNAFLTKYWSSIASILDYCADFYAHDSSLMSSLWFYLLDIWQESRGWMPCATYLSSPPSTPEMEAYAALAKDFVSDYRATLFLIDMVLHGQHGMVPPHEPIIHDPSGEKRWLDQRWNTGPFISGLKPWEQFLCSGSPGVAGFSELENEAKENGEEVRYVPQAAIAIIQTHTLRARNLAVKIDEEDEHDGELLARFDRHALVFPESTEESEHEYRSMDGVQMAYSLVNGAPPVERYRGYCDRDMVCEMPTFTLLDECVALCRGVEAYEAVSGDGDGHEDEDEDGEDEDGLEPFDMWAVYRRKDEGGVRYLPMFDDWHTEEVV